MTLIRNYLPAGPIVLDTSAIINILGCGVPEDILDSLPDACVIEDRTLGEVLRHPVPGLSHTEAVERLRRNGHLQTVRMDEVEYDLFLSLIQGKTQARLGIGESAAISVSVTRRFSVVLDDGKARRLFAGRPDRTECVSTLKLLFSAAFHKGISVDELSKIVAAAVKHARLAVPKDDLDLLSTLSL